MRLYCLAAAQGHANAQFGFGNMLSAGDGAQDKAEAIRWYRLAAAQRHEAAIAALLDLGA